MNASQKIAAAVTMGMVIAVSGCASVMSGRHADVAINSNVPQARVVVHDKQGREVGSAHTPANFALKRKDKFVFPARYTATFDAPGYEPTEVPIRSTVNPWVLGNVVIGGPIGLVIDNVTGAAWKPKHSSIYGKLEPLGPGSSSFQSAERPSTERVAPASGVY
jgi:uncharacterized protein YceK